MWRDILVTIAQLIVASPREWKEIGKEGRSESDFLNRFLHPLFGMIALTTFIGGLWLTRNGDVESALKSSIISVVAVYGGYHISSYLLNETAQRFDMVKNLSLFQRFAGYSSVVLYALFLITPFFSDFFILWILVLYTVHLVDTGAQFFMRVPQKHRVNFSIWASALVILAPALIYLLFSLLLK